TIGNACGGKVDVLIVQIARAFIKRNAGGDRVRELVFVKIGNHRRSRRRNGPSGKSARRSNGPERRAQKLRQIQHAGGQDHIRWARVLERRVGKRRVLIRQRQRTAVHAPLPVTARKLQGHHVML